MCFILVVTEFRFENYSKCLDAERLQVTFYVVLREVTPLTVRVTSERKFLLLETLLHDKN